MKAPSARLALAFSCLGHAYMHLFAALCFVIALSQETEWGLPDQESMKPWAAAIVAFLLPNPRTAVPVTAPAE